MKILFVFLLSALTCFAKIYPATDYIGTNILNLTSGVITNNQPLVSFGAVSNFSNNAKLDLQNGLLNDSAGDTGIDWFHSKLTVNTGETLNWQTRTLYGGQWTATNLTGSFYGNGAGLTNLPSSGGVTTNAFITLLPNGTNDMTAQFQSVLDSTNGLSLLPNARYYIKQIYNRSNTIEGNGATLSRIHVANDYGDLSGTNWNAMVYAGIWTVTNVGTFIGTNVIIHNLILDGGYSPNLNTFPFALSSFLSTTLCGTNHTGLLLNIAAGGEVSGITARNWDGFGVFEVSSYDQMSEKSILTQTHDWSVDNCTVGVYTMGISYFLNPTTITTYGDPEYGQINHLKASNCGIGIDMPASNFILENSDLSYNTIPLGIGYEGAGNLPAHGRISNVTMNHCTWGMSLNTSVGGEMISGVLQIITGANHFYGSSETFYGCVLGQVIIDNSGLTNLVTRFTAATQLNGLVATNGTTIIENCLVNSAVTNIQGRLQMFNDDSSLAFTNGTANSWTNVVTYLNGATYIGYGNHSQATTNTDGTIQAQTFIAPLLYAYPTTTPTTNQIQTSQYAAYQGGYVTAAANLTITKIGRWVFAGNTNVHTVGIWTNTFTVANSAVLTNLTCMNAATNGWVDVALATPLHVISGQDIIFAGTETNVMSGDTCAGYSTAGISASSTTGINAISSVTVAGGFGGFGGAGQVNGPYRIIYTVP